MKRLAFILSIVLILCLNAAVLACPMCKDCIPNSDAQSMGGVPTGFNVSVYQVDTLADPSAGQVNLPGSISFSEAVLRGLVGPNVADLSGAAPRGRRGADALAGHQGR